MKKVLLSAVIALATSAFANTDAKNFEIVKIKTKLVSSETLYPVLNVYPVLDTGVLAEVDPIAALEFKFDQIVNLGKKVWAIVEMGKPVMNIKTDIATALPMGSRTWQDLTHWQMPVSHTYETAFENLYGMDVVTFKYRVVYVYGGKANNTGAYIGYATVMPVDASVAWGFKFNAQATVPTVFNMGTADSPVGGMQLNMEYVIDSPLRTIKQSQAYGISGNGEFKALD